MSATPLLFTPLQLRSVVLPNRVVLSPLCMYAARDGVANEFHFSHLSAFARGRVGLVFTEATAVEPRGRISHGCCGLWNDEQVKAYAPIARYITELGSIPAIQLAHAGRKASARPPWEGGLPLDASDAGTAPPWQTVGPTPQAVGTEWPTPQALSLSDINVIIDRFSEAARRAAIAGFRVLEGRQAEGILQEGRADLVALGRELMYNPFWALHAAEVLGADPERKLWPESYGWAIARRAEIRREGTPR